MIQSAPARVKASHTPVAYWRTATPLGARRIGTPAPTTTLCSVVVRLDASGGPSTKAQDYPWHWKINVPDEADIDWGHSMTLG